MRPSWPGERLTQQAKRADVEIGECAAVCCAHAILRKTRLTQARDKRAAGPIHGFGVGRLRLIRHAAAGPAASRLGDPGVLGAEEWPCEMGEGPHVSCLRIPVFASQ